MPDVEKEFCMKKFVKIVAAASLAACVSWSFAACARDGSDGGVVSVYMPDGAPALAMAQLMVEEPDLGIETKYNVVDANTIQTYVSGGGADVCILPVNAAAAVAGDGKSYTMLGVVTHGNLYMLSAKYDQNVTSENLTSLVGKSVGCIQLQSFVGTVLKAVLDVKGIPYTVVEDVSQADEGKVNLINIANPATEITPAAEFDYMVAAEPVVTAKTSNGAIKVVGDLQQLYGEGGYPQAVMVAKNSLAEDEPEYITALISAVTESAEWIVSDDASAEDIVEAVNGNGGATLNVNNLKPQTISRCAVSFQTALSAREEVLAFIQKYNAVTQSDIKVSDSFFYGYGA